MQLPDYETLLARCTDALPDWVDKREGSLIHMAMAPVCLRLAEGYAALRDYYDLMFTDTAAGEYLDRLAGQYGIYRSPASAAVREAVFTGPEGEDAFIPAGSRFYIDGLFFRAEKDSSGRGSLVCETAGSAGDRCFGELQPTEYLEGLAYAELGGVLIPGEDEEDDDILRARLSERLSAPAFGGNAADYREKTRGIPGVGAVKVTPAADGGGTVKLTLLDSRYLPAEETVLALVREEICGEGNGLGLAPIGHSVSVAAAEAVPVVLTADIELSGDETDTLEAVRTAAEECLRSLRESWEEEAVTVRISALVSGMLAAEGAADVRNVTLNGKTENLLLTEEQVPVFDPENSQFRIV